MSKYLKKYVNFSNALHMLEIDPDYFLEVEKQWENAHGVFTNKSGSSWELYFDDVVDEILKRKAYKKDFNDLLK